MSKEAQAMLQKGHELMRAGNYTEALTIYQAIVTNEPNFAEPHYHSGNALICAGQENAPQALASYETAIKLDMFHAGAHFKRALELTFSFERNDEALKEVVNAISISIGIAVAIAVISMLSCLIGFRIIQVRQGRGSEGLITPA